MIGDGYTMDHTDFTDEEFEAMRDLSETEAAQADAEARNLWVHDSEAR